jgi:archaemetzincin
MPSRRHLLGLALGLPAMAWGSAEPADTLASSIARLLPLARHMGMTYPGDWLASHPEPGQTYRQYRATTPRRVIDAYKTFRVVPIGDLTAGQSAVFGITVDFLKAFFGLPLLIDAPLPLESIPATARRQLYDAATRQLLTSWLLNEPLKARRQPTDAAVLGITAEDLWPGEGWNFVFGQASLTERVGVWSMARNGNPDALAAERTACALRTVMTATHETGHMFGIRHCTAWKCGMNGANSLSERDGQPLEFCAECQPKLWWTLGLDPLKRSRALEALARKHGFDRATEALAAQSRALAG